MKSPYEARTNDEDEEGEKPQVMRMKVDTIRITTVIVIVTTVVVKTVITNIVAMIGESPLVIERMKMQDLSIKTTLMMM